MKAIITTIITIAIVTKIIIYNDNDNDKSIVM